MGCILSNGDCTIECEVFLCTIVYMYMYENEVESKAFTHTVSSVRVSSGSPVGVPYSGTSVESSEHSAILNVYGYLRPRPSS